MSLAYRRVVGGLRSIKALGTQLRCPLCLRRAEEWDVYTRLESFAIRTRCRTHGATWGMTDQELEDRASRYENTHLLDPLGEPL